MVAARRLPVHRLAKIGLVAAVVAFVLACYGSFVAETHIATSPLRKARPNAGLPAEPTSWYGRLIATAETKVLGGRASEVMAEKTTRSKLTRYTVQTVAFVLPFVLGIAGALSGGEAMRAIEAANTKYGGNFQAVFAMLIGGLAAVISGVMCFAVFVWSAIPNLYTN
jgi:hypothetical protein